jgi:hypothetical protein
VVSPEPLSINAACKLWWVNSGKFEPEPAPSHWGYLWEPLDGDFPPGARPHTCFLDQVVFYDRTGNQRLHADTVHHHGLVEPYPTLLFVADRWREVLSGSVIYHDGRWNMRWLLATNTRFSQMMNAGFETWRNEGGRT